MTTKDIIASNKPVACCRYLLYDGQDRTKAWRLDVENDGTSVKFWINGRPVHPNDESIKQTLGALMDLDQALMEIATTAAPIPVQEEP